MKYKHIWFGLFCGSAVSIMVIFSLIIFLFHQSTVFFIQPLVCILLAAFFLKSDDWYKLLFAINFVFLGFAITEIMLIGFGVLRFFYYIRYDGATRISNAFGLTAMVSYAMHIMSFAVGTVIAAILTGLKIRKQRRL